MTGSRNRGLTTTGGLPAAIDGVWGDGDNKPDPPSVRCEHPGCKTILSIAKRKRYFEREKKLKRLAEQRAKHEAELRERLGLASDVPLPSEHVGPAPEPLEPILCSPCERRNAIGEFEAEEERHRQTLNRNYGFGGAASPRHTK